MWTSSSAQLDGSERFGDLDRRTCGSRGPTVITHQGPDNPLPLTVPSGTTLRPFTKGAQNRYGGMAGDDQARFSAAQRRQLSEMLDALRIELAEDRATEGNPVPLERGERLHADDIGATYRFEMLH